MQNQMDPLDSALESLRGRRWPGDQHNSQLKDKLMQQFHTRQSSSRLGRHGALLTALALVVLAGVGFAAAGGVE
ncbi:MAG: hypothetical protein ACYS7M_01820, partial [Planctomycetota bacterium]